jgi:hypothetical protein
VIDEERIGSIEALWVGRGGCAFSRVVGDVGSGIFVGEIGRLILILVGEGGYAVNGRCVVERGILGDRAKASRRRLKGRVGVVRVVDVGSAGRLVDPPLP